MNIIFYIYNLIYQIVLLGFLLFANTYFNDLFIPKSLKWEEGKLRDDLTGLAVAQSVLLLFEGVLLIAVMYFFNRYFLGRVCDIKREGIIIAKNTAIVQALITLFFITLVIYVSFK